MATENHGEDEFHRLLGNVVDVGAQIEFQSAALLAVLVSRGDARLGLLVVGGENQAWVIGKIKRIGARFEDQLPGLAEWATECEIAFRLRNRVVHDWLAHDDGGDRTAMRFVRGKNPAHFELRPKALAEVREALRASTEVQISLASLMVRLIPAASRLDLGP